MPGPHAWCTAYLGLCGWLSGIMPVPTPLLSLCRTAEEKTLSKHTYPPEGRVCRTDHCTTGWERKGKNGFHDVTWRPTFDYVVVDFSIYQIWALSTEALKDQQGQAESLGLKLSFLIYKWQPSQQLVCSGGCAEVQWVVFLLSFSSQSSPSKRDLPVPPFPRLWHPSVRPGHC